MTPEQMRQWKRMLRGVVDSLADDAMQRRAWLEGGPEWWSPGEAFCQFFDDARIDAFLANPDTGINAEQRESLLLLRNRMRHLSDHLPHFPNPTKLLADPRWAEVQAAAGMAANLLGRKPDNVRTTTPETDARP